MGQPIPPGYNGLNYAGWVAVTNADIGSLQGSVLQVQSPPTSIFFGEEFGKTSKTNTFTVACVPPPPFLLPSLEGSPSSANVFLSSVLVAPASTISP